MATDMAVNMAERLEFDEVYYAEAGPFGTMGDVDPMEVWSDPADPDSDDPIALMQLLHDERQQSSCSILGMPGVEPVRE